jgi:hypothetical protein
MHFPHSHVVDAIENHKDLFFSAIKGVAFSIYVALSLLSAFGLILILLSTCAGTIKLVVFEKIYSMSKCTNTGENWSSVEPSAQESSNWLKSTPGGEEIVQYSFDNANLQVFLAISSPGLLACMCIMRYSFMDSVSDDFAVETGVREVGHFTVPLNFSCCATLVGNGRTKPMCTRS